MIESEVVKETDCVGEPDETLEFEAIGVCDREKDVVGVNDDVRDDDTEVVNVPDVLGEPDGETELINDFVNGNVVG